ncbi:LrgB family protein [Janibacter sp. G1551]|uniref:LrgB family protein n=1 Tax=Janibacter sp. G1551 TaxID=3420440 RepID=UPI003CFF4916
MTDVLEHLRQSPLLGLVLTLAAYRIGVAVRDRTGGRPLAQPVLVAIVVLALALWGLGLDYEVYMVGGSLIHLVLGPATVALAIPLHRQAHHLRELALPMLVAIPVGALVSIGAGILIVRGLGGGDLLERTIAAKSATTPVAIAITNQVGGVGSLVAVLTILVGILGAVAGPSLLTLLRIRDRRARGLAVGAVSHGIGTSRSMADDPTEGAFAGLAMGLTALVTSLLVPLVVHLL